MCLAAAWFAGPAEAFASPPATATALTINSNGNPVSTLIQGNLVTLTATVTSASTTLTTGQVAFCDASALYCTDVHQLAVAQLTSAGTATFRFIPRIGTQHYKAVFLGTNNYASSTSTVQGLSVTSSGYQYLSATSLAFSGSPGNYTLTATVTGGGDPAAPTGTVSFLDTSNANYVLGTATLTPGATQLNLVNSFNTKPSSGPDPAVADFNQDGIPDIAYASGANLYILLGKGDGTFNAVPAIPLPASGSQAFVADFNGDGIPDLAIHESSGSISSPVQSLQVALGKGDGTFTLLPPVVLSTGLSTAVGPYWAAGDFNGDGRTDLIVPYELTANSDTWEILLLSGNGDGTFASPAVAFQTNATGFGDCYLNVVVADFNGDGNLDLACPNLLSIGDFVSNPPPNTVTIMLGNGHGAFNLGATVAVPAGTNYIAAADFRGIGKADLAVVGFSYPVSPSVPVTNISIALGNGDGTFAPAVSLPTTFGAMGQNEIAAGDFNGDGIPDIAVTYGANTPGLITLYLGNGDGTFGAEVNSSNTIESSSAITTADFNGDGRSDLVVNITGSVYVLLSEPTSATATVSGISPVGTGIHLVDASYGGSGTVLSPSLSNTVGLQAEPAQTTLMLLAAPNSGQPLQPFTMAATLAPTTAQNHTATGTVTFSANGVTIGTVPLGNSIAAVTDTAGLPSGTYTLSATYSGDTNFASSTASLTYAVSTTAPPITFTVPNHTFGDPPFTVAATSSSPGAFSYSVISGPATINGSTVTLTGAGIVILRANQAASGSFGAGTQNAAFTVALEAQSITFPAPASPVIPAAQVTLAATASSGLPVTFSVVSGPATLSGSTISFTGLGSVVVAANQAGNANYSAAPQITRTIVVSKALPVVAISTSQNAVFSQIPVTLTASLSPTAVAPTGSVTFFAGSTVLGTATLNSGAASITVTNLALGANSITASYGGDGNYNSATSTSLTETVEDFTLSITGNATQTIQYGGTATYTLAVSPVDGSTLPSAIAFAVFGAPRGSTITFSPATLAVGNGASSVGLTIQVPSIIGQVKQPMQGLRTLSALALVVLTLPFGARLRLRGRFAGRLRSILLLAAAAYATAGIAGCGGDIITPLTQTFAVTVTASSGTLSHSAGASLVVR